MRFLLIICGIAALAWSGYWFFGSRSVESGWRDWLDARAADGWVADYSDIRTAGFPNRFDTTISDVELADPQTGIAWSAPFFQVFRLSYKPNHVIAAWPDVQTFATPHQRITVGADRIQASAVFRPDTPLELDHANFVLDNVALTSNAGWSAEVSQALFATRRAAALQNAHDIGLDATNIRPADAVLARLDPAGLLPRTFDHLKIDATLGFDAPWTLRAIESSRPAITRIDLRLAQANWGKLDLWAAGDLTIDAEGIPSGSITLRAKNWREMLQIGVSAGWVPNGLAGTLESGLGLLAKMAGNPNELDVPLNFSRGSVSLGPIPIGAAPRIALR
jgi:hypothetical protein